MHDQEGSFESELAEVHLPEGIEATSDRPGRGYLYLQGELLVAREDWDEVGPRLRDEGATVVEKLTELGLLRLQLPLDVDIPTLVDELRAVDDRAIPLVLPNHAVFGASHMQYVPATWPPRPHDALPPLPASSTAGSGVTVAVLDTGVAEAERAWFAGRVTGDAEVPDEDRDGGLDRFAGHGTFIAGVVLQHAPAADVVVKRNLHAAGYVSDAALAMALLASAGAHVINLSLGGYTHDNLGLAATARALQLLLQGNPQLSVVAAAGNDGTDRQFYPAAFNSVIAVGALGADGRRAWFSNWGWWVDASVPGVGVGSTYLHLDGGLRSTYVNMDGTLRTGTTPALYEGWAEWDGTSFASARMAGAIAVLAGSGLPPREAASRLVYGPGVARVPGLGALPRLTSFV